MQSVSSSHGAGSSSMHVLKLQKKSSQMSPSAPRPQSLLVAHDAGGCAHELLLQISPAAQSHLVAHPWLWMHAPTLQTVPAPHTDESRQPNSQYPVDALQNVAGSLQPSFAAHGRRQTPKLHSGMSCGHSLPGSPNDSVQEMSSGPASVTPASTPPREVPH